jgi:glycosyltransferase involved in cell wall biosynthesis
MKVLHVIGNRPWCSEVAVARAIVGGQVVQGDTGWVLASNSEVIARFGDTGARIVKPPLWFSPLQLMDLVPLLHLIALCRSERFSLVVTHSGKAALLAGLAARLGKIPRIVRHVQSCFGQARRSGIQAAIYRVLGRFSARADDLVITDSEEGRRKLLHDGGVDKSRVLTIPSGVPPLNPETRHVRKQLGFGWFERVIGAVGRLAVEGGFVELLQAMPRVLARHPEARLAIVGRGPLEEDLRQEATLMGLDDRVTLLGAAADAADVLSAVDIFVDPSPEPSAPLPLLQAIGAGKPVVASNNAANREIVQHRTTAILVPPANAPAIADAISRLLDDPAYATELGTRAQAAAAGRLSAQRMVDQSLTVYRQAVH